ncbi:MAG: NifB/NifX family molybdenum-iron cluster-binding protein [Desulfovibrio sp.]
MKVAISTSGKDLSAALDPRFGRAAGFLVIDTESQDFTFHDNSQNLQAAQGAGIQAAQNVAATGVKTVITGHMGPKAFMAVDRGNIDVYLSTAATVQEALEAFKAGSLEKAAGPDKQGHW